MTRQRYDEPATFTTADTPTYRYSHQRAAWVIMCAVIVALRSYRGQLGIVVAVETIAADVGRSVRTVQRALDWLEREGKIRRDLNAGPVRHPDLWHGGRTNAYYIRDEPRYEKRWRRPLHDAEWLAHRLLRILAPNLNPSANLLRKLTYLTRETVDNPAQPPPDPLACGRRLGGGSHDYERSGYCRHCGAPEGLRGLVAFLDARYPQDGPITPTPY